MKLLPGKMNYNLSGKGIFVFSDPAGANAVLALVDQLIKEGKKQNEDFIVFTNSKGVFNQKYNGLVQRVDFSDNFAKTMINKFKPNYLFTATSTNDFEHRWRKLVNKDEGIKTIAFIDHWTNYIERFTFKDEIVFADEIWVVNQTAKKEAIEAGIPQELIKVTSNPYYEKVSSFTPRIPKTEFFNKYQLDPNKQVVLFISDDIKRSFPKDEKGDCVLGFDEFTVLKDVLIAFKELENKIDWHNYQLVIKLHPRSEPNKFDQLLKEFSPNELDYSQIQNCDPLFLNYFSDIILGMFSNMVIEAMLMGKKVLRVQIGQKGDDLMKFGEKAVFVSNKNKLKEQLTNYL